MHAHAQHHGQVLTRGSQYRVEAVMQRILKARNFIAISPTKNQVQRLGDAHSAYHLRFKNKHPPFLFLA